MSESAVAIVMLRKVEKTAKHVFLRFLFGLNLVNLLTNIRKKKKEDHIISVTQKQLSKTLPLLSLKQAFYFGVTRL